MKTISRMCAPLAGRTCLLLFLCLLAGCWNSDTKQDASNQPTAHVGSAAASSDQSSRKPSVSSSAETPPEASLDDKLGFKHILQPKSTPQPKSSAALPVVARQGAEDGRYAEMAPAPAVGSEVAAAPTPTDSRKAAPAASGGAKAAKAAEVAPSVAPLSPSPYDVPRPADILPARTVAAKLDSAGSDAPPAGNPLRDPGGGVVTGRPEAPPQPAMAPEPVSAAPENSPTSAQGPRLVEKAESIIQIKTEGTSAAPPPQPAPLPALPVASAAEKRPEPLEHAAELAKPGPRTNKNSGVPFDPIKENGPIFVVDPKTLVPWPGPKLALVITGNQDGYLEPCGCAGLERMKGGMSRRYTLFRQLREKGWPVVGLDVGGTNAGDTAKGFGKQAELKFQIAVNAMSEMRYDAVALGLSDLHLPSAEVLALTMPADAKKTTMFVSGNVGLFTFDESLLPRTKLIRTGYKTIGVTAVLGKTYMQQLAGNTDLKMIGPESLLNAAVPLLKKSGANYLVLLAHATLEEGIDLGKKYPDFNLVICSGGGPNFHPVPPDNWEEIGKGGPKLIEVGEKGEYAIVLGMYDDPQRPLRYQRVTLDSRFRGSPEMLALMGAYEGQLKELGLSGLGIRPLQNPLKQSNGDYVGTDACTNCHEESYKVWKKSPHSHAFSTLQNAAPPRNYDPECISCHTVGWNPTKFFPYQSGYFSEKETPKLINVGCENCHGPGQLHVWAENHGTKAQQLASRKAVRNTKEEMADPNSHKQNCWSCHDLDNSPEFKFELYWPYVKHYEHE